MQSDPVEQFREAVEAVRGGKGGVEITFGAVPPLTDEQFQEIAAIAGRAISPAVVVEHIRNYREPGSPSVITVRLEPALHDVPEMA
ncbi:MAG: hypothetical protein A3B37_00235 [Candidatus Sungbacteria bacterium RIFCSPLOWO2_01_FULL_59_16]|uniref:Uncharacterized protein n=1 Tax=Candidatus Sungbacteria bacterium RIFCSPLOWO2_01_FULL_59_16 TaxID=1802280 RepID=A0A1G2LA67_9BACT|nr:MAG: hypothetical protein A3B37_00235 [Candidatus Sungbacteria bacterium RIFCSPLOWO2_01_FULL_59_16]